jgi:NAD(P)H-dependent FMN reductase
MVVGAAHGSLGSSRAQGHLRQILDAPEIKARIMPSAEFLLGNSVQAFNENGDLIVTEKVKKLEECFNEFTLFVKMTNTLLKDQRYRTDKKREFTWEKALKGGTI